jgi:hypothetical protein
LFTFCDDENLENFPSFDPMKIERIVSILSLNPQRFCNAKSFRLATDITEWQGFSQSQWPTGKRATP